MNGCTTCPYCGVGCGVVARTDGHRVIAVEGDRHHPANFGQLCVKGSALADTTGADSRLEAPRVDGVDCDWETAMTEVSARMQSVISQHGPGSVAMYLSGQLLTEDYYLANKLMKGFIGSPHVDTNSRLCMSSTVAGYKRAFGADAQPCSYEDIDHADLVILVGSNAAWNHPILYRRLETAKRQNPELKVVLLDPRKTASADIADLHLAIRPGTDGLIFNAILAACAARGALDSDYIAAHTRGFDAALSQAQHEAGDLAQVAVQADVPASALEQLVAWFIATPKTLTLFSQGVNQSSSGTDKVNSLINCHLATGRIGHPGMGPFSLTGQPNAMGGREVGGLANQLAAHMDPSDAGDQDRVRRFWEAPNLIDGPGHKALDLFDAIERGEIKALWVMATNPAVSLPDAERVNRLLKQCQLVVVSECMAESDTLEWADIALPATGWGEKDGTVTNSERRISRQRGLVSGPNNARHDWQIICDLAQRLGYGAAFDYPNAAAIFREHAALSGFENNGRRIFDISGLADISDADYDALAPIQWPVQQRHGTERLFTDGRFATPTGHANFIAVTSRPAIQQPTAAHPLVVNSGRVRDQWHSMTRTGRSARLCAHRPEPFIEVHPADAQAYGVAEHRLATLSGPNGRYVGRVRWTENQRRGEVFIPMHWTRQFASNGRSSELFQSIGDPISGQPESKHGIGQLSPFATAWEARLLLAPGQPFTPTSDWWSKVPLDHCVSYRLCGEQAVDDWADWVAQHLGQPQLAICDSGAQRYRAAQFKDGQLQWMLLVQPDHELPDLSWLDSQFSGPVSAENRRRLLAAQADTDGPTGPVVCSCFQVKQSSIVAAIEAGDDTTEALGLALKCGTNCGSCLPELNELIEAQPA